jgi:hypothetical protein
MNFKGANSMVPKLFFFISAITCSTLLILYQWAAYEVAPKKVDKAVINDETQRELDNYVVHLKKKVPDKDLTIIIQPPFVVVSDNPKDLVNSHAINLVKWSVDKLKKDFFPKDPSNITEIWLLKDANSYQSYALKYFNIQPSTPYGFYSSRHNAIILDISTGGGTLVHEIVHPFMEANFPACPPWFNEGMGSLYEQSTEVDNHIRGLTNWRLPGLQQAIKAKSVPSFEDLMKMDENEFYNKDKGTNYAQARYLCYYLQEIGLLIPYYKEFSSNYKDDSTGYKSLQKILGEHDMKTFQKKWEKFVLSLNQDFVLNPIE